MSHITTCEVGKSWMPLMKVLIQRNSIKIRTKELKLRNSLRRWNFQISSDLDICKQLLQTILNQARNSFEFFLISLFLRKLQAVVWTKYVIPMKILQNRSIENETWIEGILQAEREYFVDANIRNVEEKFCWKLYLKCLTLKFLSIL